MQTIVGNTISGTAGVMIAVSTASYVKGNVITQNTSGGTSHAIQVDSDCKVLDNAISNKTSHPDVGIAAKNLNLISGNTITGFIVGIRAGDSNVVTGNSASNNFSGIDCASGCLVNNNTANNNSGSSSTEGGIIAGQQSQVIDNVAKGNIGQGIGVTCPSKVADNTALSNFTNLSETGTGCLTTGNLAP